MEIFKSWIPLAVTITLLCGLVYGAVQQSYRSSANDPQIQIAEDVADVLAGGADPTAILSPRKIDVSKSLATFIMIYDDSAKVLASSAQLDGKVPELPAGIFDYVRKNNNDRLTWEPRGDARSAIVVQRYEKDDKRGFVLVGRSLREVEKREAKLVFSVGIAWVVTLFATFAAIAVVSFVSQRLNTDEPKVRRKITS